MLVVVLPLLCVGGVLSAVYGRYRFVKNKAKNSPSKKVETETEERLEERLVSPLGTPSEGTAHRKTRLPRNAVVRSGLESALSPVQNDDVPPVVAALFGTCEGRYVHIMSPYDVFIHIECFIISKT